MKRITAVQAALVLVSLLLIGLSAPVPAAPQPALGAKGTWKSDDGKLSGTWKATFVVEQFSPEGSIERIGGKITVDGMPGVTGGEVSGDVKPGTIKFGILYKDAELATFSGTMARDAKLIGTYTRPDGPGGLWEGKWTHAQDEARLPKPGPTPKED